MKLKCSFTSLQLQQEPVCLQPLLMVFKKFAKKKMDWGSRRGEVGVGGGEGVLHRPEASRQPESLLPFPST